MMLLSGRQTCLEWKVRYRVAETAEPRGEGGAGSRAEKPMFVLPLRAGSAFKVSWVRALMSPQPSLLQSCRLKLLFLWNDHLHELAQSSGDIIQKSKAQTPARSGRRQVGFWYILNTIMIVRGRLAKWCLLCRSQCWAIPYVKLFGSEFNASENKILSSTSFALCFAKWAYWSVWFPGALFLLLLIVPIQFPLILLSCSSYIVFLCPIGMGLFNIWLTGMGTLRNYLLSSLVGSWSPDKLKNVPWKHSRNGPWKVPQFIHLPSSLSHLQQTWGHLFRKAVLPGV